MLTLEQQIKEAVVLLKGLFGNHEQEPAGPPTDATVESLWNEVMELRKELRILKRTKRGVKPKVETAVKLLVEDERLAQLPIPMIAELVREVFKSYGIKCNTSESAVRWYLSQNSLEWDIIRRKLPPVKVHEDDTSAD